MVDEIDIKETGHDKHRIIHHRRLFGRVAGKAVSDWLIRAQLNASLGVPSREIFTNELGPWTRHPRGFFHSALGMAVSSPQAITD